MAKLGVFALTNESMNFVFENFSALKSHLKIIFPVVLALKFVAVLLLLAGLKPFTLVPGIFLLVTYACFALSWHRASLMGVDSAQPVNPFKMNREEWKFIGIFLAIVVPPSIIMPFVMAVPDTMMRSGSDKVMVLLALLGALAIMIFMAYLMLRLFFILPARSVGVALSYRQAVEVSKGLLWRIVAAMLFYCIIYMLMLFVYGTIVAMFMNASGADQKLTPALALAHYLVDIPAIAAGFVLMALNVTVLSKAYQWGMQNNRVS